MGFGERIRACREKKGYTQKYVAEKLNIRNSSLSMMETGKYEPSLDILKELAKLYEVTVDYLVGTSTDPRITAEQEKRVNEQTEQMMRIYEEASPEDKIILETMWKAYLEARKKTVD